MRQAVAHAGRGGAGQKRKQQYQKTHFAPHRASQPQAAGYAEVDVDQVMPWREAECAAAGGREVHVPHLFEVAAEVAALALQEEIDTVAREDLGDLARA